MFDSIVLNRSIDKPTLTAGEIAEALIFYQNIHLVLDTSSLMSLIREIGPHNVIKLISLPDVKTTFIEEFVGVFSENTENGTEHALISAFFSGDDRKGEIKNWKKRLEHLIFRQGLSKTEAVNFVERLKRLVTLKKLSSDHFICGGVINAARRDLNDSDYISSAARIIVGDLMPNEDISEDFIYKITPSKETFKIYTNINFERINQHTHQNGPATPATIAAAILSASYGLILAAHYGGDFHTSLTDSKLISHKNKLILTRSNANRRELELFNEIILKGIPNVSFAINSKERTFEEFLELLSKAKRFKKWLKGKSPDESLVANYLEDISKTGWIGSGKGKVLRYLANTGLGIIGPTTGLITSALDTFILEKFIAGWKPNQFISSKLIPFIDINDEL